ncbi:methyltransferase [Amphibacillus xylanus]|uniref:Methyltransferase domain-containing protein n=1 Tax=Amphibacillus xylanus (strain ATCC 51415 / DSM 6626 / JCM 7361 / LMG 17667 / NBRC 15112 / Ep01) TaxID=698758 RepID=K0J5U6_AMPXN|nr:methyltransferase [Amphibacillus xylanus]BAM48436.1 hypothetical protein AXY_23040 [Amphibacillus xylanus NBRC 15112]
MLQVKTDGLRESQQMQTAYNRYEATPYIALEQLIEHYKLRPEDHVVDFGCGKGRVSFFLHYHFDVPVTGIEMNDLTFDEALRNKELYKMKNTHLQAPIQFKFGLAEHYQIKPEDNVFYFFHPFSIKIFKKVVYNILDSVLEHSRTVDIVFYYPLPEFKDFLKNHTPFRLINKIKAYKKHGRYGKFLIYRLD